MSDPADTTPSQEEPAQAPSQEGPNVYYYDDATKESVSSVEYDSRSGGYGGGFVIPPAGSTAYGSERNYSDNDSKYSNNRSSSYGSRNNDFYGYDIPTAGSGGDNSRKGNPPAGLEDLYNDYLGKTPFWKEKTASDRKEPVFTPRE